MQSEIETPQETPRSEGIEQVEAFMLNQPQIDCPVSHHFGPGIYIREVTLPKGIYAIGHAQKHKHLNVVIKGKVAMVDGDQVRIIEAPLIFTGGSGRKIGYVIETCVWQNVYATEETDVEKLESMFLDKSETWLNHNEELKNLSFVSKDEDRDDYLSVLDEYGFTEEVVWNQSTNELDQIEMPEEWRPVTTKRESPIHGVGLFMNWPIKAGTVVSPARISGKRTPAGRFVNHSKTPNCKYVFVGGDIYLVSLNDISGCKGGSNGEELTVNYRQALSLSGLKGG